MIFGVVMLRYVARSGTEYWPLYSCVCGRGGAGNRARVSGTNLTVGRHTRTGETEGDLIPRLLYENLGMRLALLLSVRY